MSPRSLVLLLVAGLLAAGCAGSLQAPVVPSVPAQAAVAVSGSLTASGATFPKPFYEEAIAQFKKANPRVTDITYPGGGSGKGREDLQKQLNDFSGSDSPVTKPEDLAKYAGGAVLHVPTVIAPITLAYNVSGVDELRLTPDTIARIFQRQITRWDDPALVADNPQAGARLKGPITVARRSDSSGTTDNFTKFLDKAAGPNATGVWTRKSGSTIEWPPDTQGGNGNGGVGQIIKDTPGAIGYLDYSDATAIGLRTAAVRNKAGAFVAPTLAGASAAAAGATVDDKLVYSPLWVGGADAYPITAPTWVLVYAVQPSEQKAVLVREFLRFLLTGGQALAPAVDFAPLPPALATKALAQLDKIQARSAT